MRIIRGKHSGRRISPPKNLHARPTTDFAKEGLFNIIDNNISQIERTKMCVLDLFSGTGNICYEFLSRGFKHGVAVEISKRHAKFITETASELFDGEMDVIITDAFKYIKKANLTFDIIFADPPYELSKINEIPDLVFGNETCLPTVLLIVEHSERVDFSLHPQFYHLRKYGKVHFSFFKRKETK